MNKSIPMSSPDLLPEEVEAVSRVLQTPYLSIGPQIEAFEQAMAAYCGAEYAVAVVNGTAGLHLAVIAAGVEESDLVITTPFSFVASSNCILYERAVPILVDIEPQTLNVDPVLVAAAADDLARGGRAAEQWLPPSLRGTVAAGGSQVKAILPVDAFGQPADYDLIKKTAQEHNLLVLEDSCEAIGAEYRGQMAGTLGDVGIFAFYPNKQMTTGEGGVIVTDCGDWNALFRSLRNQGRDVFDSWLSHTRLGYNYRMDEMSAALGLAQLGRLEELLAKRERVAHMYNERLAAVDGIAIPSIAATTTRVSWFVYVIRLASEIDRNRVMADLKERGVPSRPYFSPIHLQPFYVERFGYQRGDFPVAESAGDTCLALPFSSVMTEEQVDYVCAALRAAI